MNIDTLKSTLPEFAKDLKLNLSGLENIENLKSEQRFGIMIAAALAAGNLNVIEAVLNSAAENNISEATITAAKAANSLMAMTNVYYRGLHFMEDKSYMSIPANLRMNFMKNPGVEKADFELYSLAVSAVNGCSFCVKAHETGLLKAGLEKAQIQQAIRISAIMHAFAKTL